jgi:bifunctional ADP-heptose synthase (sugar kinase/adenylyltransferase)
MKPALTRERGRTLLDGFAAGIAVGKVGTATASQSELLTDFNSRNADPTG